MRAQRTSPQPIIEVSRAFDDLLAMVRTTSLRAFRMYHWLAVAGVQHCERRTQTGFGCLVGQHLDCQSWGSAYFIKYMPKLLCHHL